MHWTDKLERRYGRFAIPNLINILLAGQVVTGLIALLFNANILTFLPLTRYGLMQGKIWQLVTFLFYPSWIFGTLGFLNLVFYFWVGNTLTRLWGDFKMTLFIALGMVGAWISCLISGGAGASGVFMSLFFAYAWLWPNQQVLLFGIVPLKVKWLGWFELAVWLLDFVRGGLTTRVSLVLGLAGFLGFYGREVLDWCRDTVVSWKRRRDWQDRNR